MTHYDHCPGCGAELGALGTFCADCGDYCEEIAAKAGKAPTSEPSRVPGKVPDDRLEDARRNGVRQTLERIPGTDRWPHGFVVLDLEQSRKGTRVRKGIADLAVMGFGEFAWVEMKTDKGVQSADQIAFEKDCIACGVPYFVWRGEDEASAWGRDVRENTIMSKRQGP